MFPWAVISKLRQPSSIFWRWLNSDNFWNVLRLNVSECVHSMKRSVIFERCKDKIQVTRKLFLRWPHKGLYSYCLSPLNRTSAERHGYLARKFGRTLSGLTKYSRPIVLHWCNIDLAYMGEQEATPHKTHVYADPIKASFLRVCAVYARFFLGKQTSANPKQTSWK